MHIHCKAGMSSAILVAFTLTLGGCAFGTREAVMRYPPRDEIGLVPAAQAAAAPGSRNTAIVLAGFQDLRQDKRLVGAVRNGFGMVTADVIVMNSVPEWVTEAAATELRNAGYTVSPKTEGQQTAAVLSGDILNVFCDAFFTYDGQISLNVTLRRNGSDLLSKTYLGKGTSGMNWAATSEGYAESLALALSDALKQMTADVNARLQSE